MKFKIITSLILVISAYFLFVPTVFAIGGVQIDIFVKKIYLNASGQPLPPQPISGAKISWFRSYAGHSETVPWGSGDDLFTNSNGLASTTVNACGGKFQLQLITESITNLEPGGRWNTFVNKYYQCWISGSPGPNGIRYASLINKNTYPDVNQYPGLWVFWFGSSKCNSIMFK